eukprot:scpid93282/ scgid20916/ 
MHLVVAAADTLSGAMDTWQSLNTHGYSQTSRPSISSMSGKAFRARSPPNCHRFRSELPLVNILQHASASNKTQPFKINFMSVVILSRVAVTGPATNTFCGKSIYTCLPGTY